MTNICPSCNISLLVIILQKENSLDLFHLKESSCRYSVLWLITLCIITTSYNELCRKLRKERTSPKDIFTIAVFYRNILVIQHPSQIFKYIYIYIYLFFFLQIPLHHCIFSIITEIAPHGHYINIPEYGKQGRM